MDEGGGLVDSASVASGKDWSGTSSSRMAGPQGLGGEGGSGENQSYLTVTGKFIIFCFRSASVCKPFFVLSRSACVVRLEAHSRSFS